MAINIDTLVHNEFGRSASDQLVKLTGKPTAQVQSGVDRAITEILDGFSIKAREESGRQSIYEAARYCDDGLIDDPEVFFGSRDARTALLDSNNALSTLLGGDKRNNIADAVRSASSLSAADADMVVGLAAPGVLGVMKRQMLNGAVLDNSDGIGQMLLGEVTSASAGGASASIDHTVPKTAPRQTQSTPAAASMSAAAGGAAAGTSTGGAAVAATADEKESDLSWLFRWMLPFLLLGGLVLAGLQDCAGNNVAGVATSAQKLAMVETEVEGLNGQITTLTAERDEALSDRETAVTEIDRLQGELETVSTAVPDTTELDAATAEIATLKEQLAQPADTSELDAANAEITSLKEQLAQPVDTSELDAANAEVASLKEQLAQPVDTSELDAANAEIASLKDQLAEPADTGALNAEILSLRGQLANLPAPVDNSSEIMGLQQSVDDSNLKVAQLESELTTVRDSRTEVEESMAMLSTEKTKADNRIADLKEKLLNVAGAKNRMETTVAGLTSERDSAVSQVEVMQANLNRAVDDATAKRKELVASQGQISGLTSSIGSLESDVASSAEKLRAAEASVLSLTEASEATDAELEKVTKGRSAAITTVTDLVGKLDTAEAERDALQAQTATMQEQIDAEKDKQKALNTRLGNAISFSKERGMQLSMLQDEAGSAQEKNKALSKRLNNAIAFSKERRAQAESEVASLTKSRSAAVTTVKDLVGKLRAAESERNALQTQTAMLQEQIDAEQDKQKALNNRLNNAISFSKERGMQLGMMQDQASSAQEKNKVLSKRLNNAIAFSKERGAQAASLTKSRGAAITTVKDLVGKLRAAESERSALQTQAAMLQEQIDAGQDKQKALNNRLNNAIAFSKERATQIDSMNGEIQGLDGQISEADNSMQAEQDRVASVSASLSDELAAAGLGNVVVSPVEDNQAVGITMGSSDLYRVGSASLSPQGIDMLDTVGSIVGNYGGSWRIDIEGHTDGQPIGGVLQQRYATNWELSVARAAAAVRLLESRTGISPQNMSVRGFGEHKPIATNDTAEGREANRRIELILRRLN